MNSKLTLAARILLGLIFFVFGLAGLLNLMPPPDNLPENMITFMKGMEASGYMFKLIKGTEVVCGAMLLTGMFVPLALVVLAPIVLNIFLTHAFLAPEGLPLAIVIGLLLTYLAFFASPYKQTICQLFRRK